MEKSSLHIARYILGFSWIYHGLFPKLLSIAPTEAAMTATFGFSETGSYWITKVAGIGEIIFGIILIIFYKNRWLHIANITALSLLCLFVAVNIPFLLIDAFNPVTTNLTMIALSYILIKNT